MYHMRTMSDLAVTYNDISVLENYHLAETFKILKRPDCNWYHDIPSKPIQKYFRQALIEIVLATDMKFHQLHQSQLTGLVGTLKQQLHKRTFLRANSDSLASTHSIPLNYSILVPNNRPQRGASAVSGISNSTSASTPKDPDTPGIESMTSISRTRMSSSKDLDLDTPRSDGGKGYELAPRVLSDLSLYKYDYKPLDMQLEALLATEVEDTVVAERMKKPRVVDVKDERRFMLCWLVHLCDISNVTKSIKSGKRWGVAIMTEFFKQGDRERALGLDVSAMMDRRRSSMPSLQVCILIHYKLVFFPMDLLYPIVRIWEFSEHRVREPCRPKF